ncbi:MAG: hypothetical protein U1E62_13010 [Alsobacter sp.]
MSAPPRVRGRSATPLIFPCPSVEPAEVYSRFFQALARCEAALTPPRAVPDRGVRRRARRVSAQPE